MANDKGRSVRRLKTFRTTAALAVLIVGTGKLPADLRHRQDIEADRYPEFRALEGEVVLAHPSQQQYTASSIFAGLTYSSTSIYAFPEIVTLGYASPKGMASYLRRTAQHSKT